MVDHRVAICIERCIRAMVIVRCSHQVPGFRHSTDYGAIGYFIITLFLWLINSNSFITELFGSVYTKKNIREGPGQYLLINLLMKIVSFLTLQKRTSYVFCT